MVPTFGLFDKERKHAAYVSAEDQERAGYLSEVVLHSTEFGVGAPTEFENSRGLFQTLTGLL